MSALEVRITRLPHGQDLPLPSYQSAHAAGLDLFAAVPAQAPVTLAPGARALIPTGLVIALPPTLEARCGRGPDWLRSATASRCSIRRAPSTPIIAANSKCCL